MTSRRSTTLRRLAIPLAAILAYVVVDARDARRARLAIPLAAPAAHASVRDEAVIRDGDIAFYTRRADEDPGSALDRSVLAGLLLARASSSGSASDLAHAERLARRSLAIRTERNGHTFELLASVLMARHAFREARVIAARADSLEPETPSHLALLGEIELELGQYDSAATHFRAIHFDGEQFTIGARLARWYEVTGKADVARDFLQRAIRRVSLRDDLPREQVAWFHYRLGELELRLGKHDAADSAFAHALAVNAQDVRALGGQARVALARHDWRRAADIGERATAIQLDPATLGAVSIAFAARGDSAQAASFANAMTVSARGQPGTIHRAWAHFLLDHGTSRDRTVVLARARRDIRERSDVYGRDLLAWALYRTGHVQEARAEMAQALAQRTQDVLLTSHARAIGVEITPTAPPVP